MKKESSKQAPKKALRKTDVSGRSEQCAHEYKVDDNSDIPFDLICQKCGKTA